MAMWKYMPKLNSPLEWVHQGTNSLSVTLCDRSSPDCEGASTYIFTIIQLKTFYLFHGIYEPYVMLFNPAAPFELHGLSSKPLWYSGRWKSNATWTMDSDPMQEQGDQLFTTSMSWKSKGRKYHGYLDDELFIAMGRGDSASRGLRRRFIHPNTKTSGSRRAAVFQPVSLHSSQLRERFWSPLFIG
ncbi:hypothetical protein KC340_g107 [Hortaea werneckii]|nr:hypothetical protein KC340_g107 [Hortaea werneckii]